MLNGHLMIIQWSFDFIPFLLFAYKYCLLFTIGHSFITCKIIAVFYLILGLANKK
jgi:hypothetical protein